MILCLLLTQSGHRSHRRKVHPNPFILGPYKPSGDGILNASERSKCARRRADVDDEKSAVTVFHGHRLDPMKRPV